MKKFLVDCADMYGFDPFNPETWYSISRRDILAAGGVGLLYHFGGSHKRAIWATFPNIGLVRSKLFKKRDKGVWLQNTNWRNFLVNLAHEMDLDPIDVSHWYTVSTVNVVKAGGRGMLVYTGYSYRIAIQEAFPEIGIDMTKFTHGST